MYIELKSLVTDFLVEERIYFTELEKLAQTKDKLGEIGALWTTSVNELFAPLSYLCRSQLQFLLDMEGTHFRPASQQRWARPFFKWSEAAEVCYTDFAVNEKNKREILSVWAEKCVPVDASMKPMFETCVNFLPLPYLRLKKYLSFLQVCHLQPQINCLHLPSAIGTASLPVCMGRRQRDSHRHRQVFVGKDRASAGTTGARRNIRRPQKTDQRVERPRPQPNW